MKTLLSTFSSSPRCALRLLPLLLLLPLLTGCASKEPLDYLPAGDAYLAINMEQVRQDEGSRRLVDVLQKLGSTPTVSQSNIDRLYLSFAGIPSQITVYGVVIGKEGYADQAMADLKQAGGAETKLNGRPAVVSEKFSITPLGEKAVLFYATSADLARMIDTAKRKSPGAAGTPLFRRTQDLTTSSGIAMSVNAAPLLAMAGPQLGLLSVMNPAGVEALKKSETFYLTLDWNEQPEIHATLVGPSEGRDQLAALLNTLLGQVRGRVPAGAQAGMLTSVLANLEVEPSTEGVQLQLAFPREDSQRLLERMESTATNLPSDPAERARALQEAFRRQN